MAKVPFLDLKSLNAPYMDVLKNAACSVVESGWYIRGHFCERFEQAFAEYCGVKYAVGVGNGLDALTLILRASMELGRLHEGDEILVPSNTFIATVLAVSAVGLKPVLVEPSVNTYDMDPKQLEKACGARTRAILDERWSLCGLVWFGGWFQFLSDKESGGAWRCGHGPHE